jgi:hypothetical protein
MSRERVSSILCINERDELERVLSLSDIAQIVRVYRPRCWINRA